MRRSRVNAIVLTAVLVGAGLGMGPASAADTTFFDDGGVLVDSHQHGGDGRPRRRRQQGRDARRQGTGEQRASGHRLRRRCARQLRLPRGVQQQPLRGRRLRHGHLRPHRPPPGRVHRRLTGLVRRRRSPPDRVQHPGVHRGPARRTATRSAPGRPRHRPSAAPRWSTSATRCTPSCSENGFGAVDPGVTDAGPHGAQHVHVADRRRAEPQGLHRAAGQQHADAADLRHHRPAEPGPGHRRQPADDVPADPADRRRPGHGLLPRRRGPQARQPVHHAAVVLGRRLRGARRDRPGPPGIRRRQRLHLPRPAAAGDQRRGAGPGGQRALRRVRAQQPARHHHRRGLRADPGPGGDQRRRRVPGGPGRFGDAADGRQRRRHGDLRRPGLHRVAPAGPAGDRRAVHRTRRARRLRLHREGGQRRGGRVRGDARLQRAPGGVGRTAAARW